MNLFRRPCEKKENLMMFKNSYWLGVGLMTLVAFGLTAPSAPAQVYPLPNAGGATWPAQSAAMDRNNNIYAVGSGGTTATEFIAASLTGNGAVNTAFGGGVVTTKVGTYPEYTGPAVCAVQVSGTSSKLISAGGYYNSKGRSPGVYAALVRYNANGHLGHDVRRKRHRCQHHFPGRPGRHGCESKRQHNPGCRKR